MYAAVEFGYCAFIILEFISHSVHLNTNIVVSCTCTCIIIIANSIGLAIAYSTCTCSNDPSTAQCHTGRPFS